jgi:hypothetical protein
MSDITDDDVISRQSMNDAVDDVGLDRNRRSRERDDFDRRDRYDKRHPGKEDERFLREGHRGRSRTPSRSPETPPSDPRLKRYRSGPRTPSRSPPPNSR